MIISICFREDNFLGSQVFRESIVLETLLVLSLEEGLVGCATVCVKSEVILVNAYSRKISTQCNRGLLLSRLKYRTSSESKYLKTYNPWKSYATFKEANHGIVVKLLKLNFHKQYYSHLWPCFCDSDLPVIILKTRVNWK